MNVLLVSGSPRNASQSRKVADYLATQINGEGHTADVIDLAGNPLPLWDGQAGKPESATGKVWKDFSARLQAAEALIIIAPEWHGMAPAGLKNFLLHCTAKDVGHKPALIVGVSASRGGSHPIDELRISSYKNNRILYIPDHVIVREVGAVLNGAEESSAEDGYIRRRLGFARRTLYAYGEAMTSVRAAGVTENAEFPFGM